MILRTGAAVSLLVMATGGHDEVAPEGEHRTRTRIIQAALRLLADHHGEELSTRAVCRLAGVQAPAIYRIFGHKQGLIDAAAADGFDTYTRSLVVRPPCADPVDGLRRGWDLHVQFALDEPTLYVLTYGHPRPGPLPPAAAKAAEMLGHRIRRVAEAGRLRLAENHATQLLQAGACGTALTLIGTEEQARDLEISYLARESLISTITTSPPTVVKPDLISAAVHVRSALRTTAALTEREISLLEEWIDRITDPATAHKRHQN